MSVRKQKKNSAKRSSSRRLSRTVSSVKRVARRAVARATPAVKSIIRELKPIFSSIHREIAKLERYAKKHKQVRKLKARLSSAMHHPIVRDTLLSVKGAVKRATPRLKSAAKRVARTAKPIAKKVMARAVPALRKVVRAKVRTFHHTRAKGKVTVKITRVRKGRRHTKVAVKRRKGKRSSARSSSRKSRKR